MTLEAIADYKTHRSYDFELKNENGVVTIDIGVMLEKIVEDRTSGADEGVISAKFHNTATEFFLALSKQAREQTGIKTIAISGGVFCNRFLLERLIELLQNDGFNVLFNKLVPTNDGGISLGQAAIAAKAIKKG
jgi:hydrogenase maturation protein HypF